MFVVFIKCLVPFQINLIYIEYAYLRHFLNDIPGHFVCNTVLRRPRYETKESKRGQKFARYTTVRTLRQIEKILTLPRCIWFPQNQSSSVYVSLCFEIYFLFKPEPRARSLGNCSFRFISFGRERAFRNCRVHGTGSLVRSCLGGPDCPNSILAERRPSSV